MLAHTRIDRPAGLIRQLRPSDLSLFTDHLKRLDAASRRDRFNGMTDDDYLTAYAYRCFHEGVTVIGYVEDGKVLGAAELHEIPDEDGEPTAEIAFSVERSLQHKGLGGRLFERLIVQAEGFGYQRLRVTTHSGNGAMKALARRFNAVLSFEAGEATGVIELSQAGQRDVMHYLKAGLSAKVQSNVRSAIGN
ncbi:GNAT family N-acetyltransferase [Oryzicola mucosus]|uniref:GNAT family N-acetyltransferase n=1 Tax=Oryzicola mucosus TaxID=2767425 RepID=A0A8J6PL10_9HYPH|nr:GNAT family N-acetyltransferase [Oryzicola mucosus]MBD0416388.1 GNAT family N-acetyltransferase [Oryzicola mucosus]